MAVGTDVVARMAREDARWFVVAIVILGIVLCLALPLQMLVVIDHMKVKAQVKAEIKKLESLKAELRKEVSHVANRRGDSSEPNQ